MGDIDDPFIMFMERFTHKPLYPAQKQFAQLVAQGYRVKYDRVRGLHMVKEENEKQKGDPQDQQ